MDESGDSEYDPLKHSVLHNFNISLNIVPDASLQILNMRELPITRADNPFGSETAPEDDSTGSNSILLWRFRLSSFALRINNLSNFACHRSLHLASIHNTSSLGHGVVCHAVRFLASAEEQSGGGVRSRLWPATALRR